MRRDGRGPREYLADLELFGVKLGLASIRAICDALGHPERHYPTVHVAGTNGKGSVAVMTATALHATGRRTGCYTSPHLIRLEERFAIDGTPVASADLDDAIDVVRTAVEELQSTRVLDLHPTFFEVTTAVAFELFRRAGVHCAVFEVGLGGRFDATNVIEPAAAAIVSISHDHEQHLGSTLPEIAAEKAGIAKRGVPLVIGPLPPEARAVVADTAGRVGAPIVDASEGAAVEAYDSGGHARVTIRTPAASYEGVRLALRGMHQAANALVAVRLLEVLHERGLAVTAEAIRAGLESARWPARLQLFTVPGRGDLLLDGAHNPAGTAALADFVRHSWPRGVPIVFGAMADKNIPRMLEPLADLARPLIATRAPGRRAAEAADIAAHAAAVGIDAVLVEEDLARAIGAGWAHHHVVVVAGSLFLAGQVFAFIDAEGGVVAPERA